MIFFAFHSPLKNNFRFEVRRSFVLMTVFLFLDLSRVEYVMVYYAIEKF